MLLRLLPPPTATQSNPPTILFTLSFPDQPYTAKSLPLPGNLMAHRSVCLQEEIECPNALLGEKSSWLVAIVQDVTFSLKDATVSIELVDGSKTVHTVSTGCAAMLQSVCHEVELSLIPSLPPSLPPTPTCSPPRSRTVSGESTAGPGGPIEAGPSRPSVVIPKRPSFLYSLISPLLPGVTGPARALIRPQPARFHRRQARSILVDTFRRYILPTLKAQLPAAYLPWMAEIEIKRLVVEFETLRRDVDSLLDRYAATRSRPTDIDMDLDEGCVSETSSVCDSDSTPATSVYSDAEGQTCPQAYLLSVPPAHTLPFEAQRAYATALKRITPIASRMLAVKRLSAKYAREESKRVWLETLERGRIADRALRRAMANGDLRPEQCRGVEPPTRSKLWCSWSAGDQARAEESASRAVHPAMMGMSDGEASDDEEEEGPVTPSHAVFPGRAVTVGLPAVVVADQFADPCGRVLDPVCESDNESDDDDTDTDAEREPDLTSSSSSDSLEAWREDVEVRTPSASPEAEDREASACTAVIMPRRPSLGRGHRVEVVVVEGGGEGDVEGVDGGVWAARMTLEMGVPGVKVGRAVVGLHGVQGALL